MSTGGAGEEVKLLGLWASPYVIRARIALNIKGVGYEFLEETYGRKSDLLVESNPVYKKMPILIHGGKALCESMIIVQYVDDVWTNSKPSLLPTDPYELAMARFWAVYIDDKWACSLIWMLRATTDEAKAAAIEQAGIALQTLEKAFEKHYKGKPFFGGETIGYLDIALGSYVGWIGVLEKMSGGVALLDGAKIPLLVGWVERFWSHDAVKSVTPEADRFVEFSKVVLAVRAAQAAAK